MQKKLILISGSPCVGKTVVGDRLFESYDNSAYLDGDWCWCVHPFSVTDRRLRNGDKSMSFILNGITAKDYQVIGFTLTCSEETLKKRHDKRGDKGETNYYWLHLPPCSEDIVIDTDHKRIGDIVKEMMQHINRS